MILSSTANPFVSGSDDPPQSNAAFLETLWQLLPPNHAGLFHDPPAGGIPCGALGIDLARGQFAEPESQDPPERFSHVATALMVGMCPEADIPKPLGFGPADGNAPDELSGVGLDGENVVGACPPRLAVPAVRIEQVSFLLRWIPGHTVVEALKPRCREHMGDVLLRNVPEDAALGLEPVFAVDGHGSGFVRAGVPGDCLPELADHFPHIDFRKAALIAALDQLAPSVEEVVGGIEPQPVAYFDQFAQAIVATVSEDAILKPRIHRDDVKMKLESRRAAIAPDEHMLGLEALADRLRSQRNHMPELRQRVRRKIREIIHPALGRAEHEVALQAGVSIVVKSPEFGFVDDTFGRRNKHFLCFQFQVIRQADCYRKFEFHHFDNSVETSASKMATSKSDGLSYRSHAQTPIAFAPS